MLSYFLYTIFSLGASYVVYYWLLRKQKTFQFNRLFLISSLVLCLVAPLIEVEIFNFAPSITQIPLQTITEATSINPHIEEVTFQYVASVSELPKSPLFYIYLSITLFLLFRFFMNLIKLYKLTRVKYKRFNGLKIIESTDSEMVSSFFNYLFIPKEHILKEADYLSVLQHETVHCKQLHTLDIIIVELLLCVFWFNPFAWFYKNAILQNHEYIADDQSVSAGIDIEKYSNTIINLGNKEYRIPLTSGFNFIQIKNRIIMLHQTKSSLLKRSVKIVSVFVLFVGIFVFSSYKDLKEPLIVVIDAGHGGHDSGNLNEKDIVLNISNHLALLSNNKVKLIMTRADDRFFTLKDRVEFINAQNADLVLSLHCNASNNEADHGVEAYYYDKNEFKDASYAYSKILVEKQMNVFSNNRGLKTAGMYVLKNSNSPGVILELGFITNKKDKTILMHSESQKAIAKSIFDGLVAIRNSK